MALIPSRWINIFIPSLLKPEGSSTLESKKGRKKERESEMESRRRSTGKEWQMEGWINVEMNQQQSNKATARFSGSTHNSSDVFPPWHNYHSPPNYFFSPSETDFWWQAVLFFYDRVCKVAVLRAVVQPCRLRLCPQTAQEGGRGWRGRRRWGSEGGREEVREGGGGLSLENGQGPRPALPWTSNCARILMTCVYSMWAQMADRFRGLLCFPFHCFLLVSRQLIFTF